MVCKSCGSWATGKLCDTCEIYFNDEKPIIKTKQKEVKIVNKMPNKKLCECCKKDYKPRAFYQKFCSDECRPKPMTEAEKWINAKPRAKNLNSNQVAYGFFRKKYGVSNRFIACRG